MNQQQSALAYARAYELFSQVYQHGLNDDIAPLLITDTEDTNHQYGAEHYQLFVHNVFPYESIFLGDDGLLGGTITEGVAGFYQRIGFVPASDESADHISTELSAMAYLCFAELDAIEDEIPHQVERLRQLQRRFLDEHLMRWLPAFVFAVEQQDPNIYADVVRQSFELVCRHRAQLGDDLMATSNSFVLTVPPDLLADEKTSLRDIARYLLTPAYTGFFLSVADIRRIGARFRVPHGFGKRQQILTNLLRTASDYDLFPDIMADFNALATQWQKQFEAIPALHTDIRLVWIERLEATSTVLTTMETMAREQNILLDENTIEDM